MRVKPEFIFGTFKLFLPLFISVSFICNYTIYLLTLRFSNCSFIFLASFTMSRLYSFNFSQQEIKQSNFLSQISSIFFVFLYVIYFSLVFIRITVFDVKHVIPIQHLTKRKVHSHSPNPFHLFAPSTMLKVPYLLKSY